MRKKRVELQEAVIVAARNYVTSFPGSRPLKAYGDLCDAVKELDSHEAAALTGQGARWVRGAPETSRESAVRATPIQGSTRYRIIKVLASTPSGHTDEDLEQIIGGRHQTVSSARNWLVEAGWVRDTGLRAQTKAGRDAVLWEITPAGKTAMERMQM